MEHTTLSAKGNKRWELIREDFIAQNLRLRQEDPPYTLKMVAESWGVSYAALRQKAASQRWMQIMKERRDKLREEAESRLHEVALFDELEIRTRQATYARLASSIAFQKLQSLDEKAIAKMSVKDAVELLKIGLGEERQSLGIGDTLRVQPPTGADRAVLSEQQVFAVARRVLELRKSEDGSYAQREPVALEHQPAEPAPGNEESGDGGDLAA